MLLDFWKSRSPTFVLRVLVTVACLGLAIWLQNRRKSEHRHKAAVEMKMLPSLQKPWIHMADPGKVEEIINNMIQDGSDHLQIIADFDRTISAYQMNGRLVDTCHQALDQAPILPNEYSRKAASLREHYYAIEVDPNLTFEEKLPHMVEWWARAHDLMVETSLTRDSLKTIVRDSNIQLRTGSLHMFEELHRNEVPMLIFSAGVGDIIDEALSQRGKLYDNMKVVSNYMDFNDQGELIGFKGDTIHIFNKNKSAINKSDYFESIKHRHNIILLGDSLGDLSMADGAHNMKNILRIGFLNDKIDVHLETYKNLYDIVLVSDETMDVPAAILEKIL